MSNRHRSCSACGCYLDPQERCTCQVPSRPQYEVVVTFNDGDTITTRWSGTPQDAVFQYPIGSLHNVGLGPHDCFKTITGVAIREAS